MNRSFPLNLFLNFLPIPTLSFPDCAKTWRDCLRSMQGMQWLEGEMSVSHR